MKVLTWIIILAVIVGGYLLVTRSNNMGINKTPNIAELERKSAAEPTAEELIDQQFGIPEDEAEARYAAEMKQQ